MRTFNCPLCDLRFPTGSELEAHARDDHPHRPLRRKASDDPVPGPREHEPDPEHVLRLPW